MKNNDKTSNSIINFFLSNRKIKYNGLITIFIFMFIAIVLLFNVVLCSILDRFDIKLDLSSKNIYKVSKQTKEFLKDYNRDVKMVVLNDEDSLKLENGHIYNMIKSFASCNSHISVEYLNLNERPDFASKYPDLDLRKDGILIMDYEDNVQYIPVEKLFQRQVDDSFENGGFMFFSDVEGSIARALEFISGQNRVKTAVLNGHDELDFSSLENIFKENGYEIEHLNMLTKPISDETELIFIAEPRIDFTDEDIDKLSKYLERGGRIVYFTGASQPKLKNLDSFFTKFGINFKDGVVVDANSNNVIYNTPNFMYLYVDKENSYTENMVDRKIPILFNDCRPIYLNEEDKSLQIVNICSTSSSCSVYSEDENFDIETAARDSYPLAVGVTKNNDSGKAAKITVFSSLYLLGTMDMPQSGNGAFILSVLGETADHKSKVKILPKPIGAPPFIVSTSEAKLIGIIFIFILPLGVMLVGFFVCLKRRNLRYI